MTLYWNMKSNYYIPFKASNFLLSNLNKLQSILLYYKWTADIYTFTYFQENLKQQKYTDCI